MSVTDQIEALMFRKKGGRSKGTTNYSKKDLSDVIIAAKNEIIYIYLKKKRNGQGKY